MELSAQETASTSSSEGAAAPAHDHVDVAPPPPPDATPGASSRRTGIAPDPRAMLPYVDADGAPERPESSASPAQAPAAQEPAAQASTASQEPQAQLDADVTDIIARYKLPSNTDAFSARQFQVTVMWGEQLLSESKFNAENYYSSASKPRCPIAHGYESMGNHRTLYTPFRSQFIARFTGDVFTASQLCTSLNEYLPAGIKAAARRSMEIGFGSKFKIWVKTHPELGRGAHNIDALSDDAITTILRFSFTVEEDRVRLAQHGVYDRSAARDEPPAAAPADGRATADGAGSTDRNHLTSDDVNGVKSAAPLLVHYNLHGETAEMFREGMARIRAVAEPITGGNSFAIGAVTSRARTKWAERWETFVKASGGDDYLNQRRRDTASGMVELPRVDDLLPEVEAYATKWMASRG